MKLVPKALELHLSRKRAGFERVVPGRFSIRVARTAREYEDAFRLVHVAYVMRGISPLTALDLRITEQHMFNEATVIVAYEGDQIVGTVTVTRDSPAGLPLDKDYPRELEALRAVHDLAEVGSLAIVQRCQGEGLMHLLGAASTAFGTTTLGVGAMVFGINPPAQRYYEILWGARPLGQSRRHGQLAADVVGVVAERTVTEAIFNRYPGRMHDGRAMRDFIFRGEPIAGVEIPRTIDASFPRWKMSREVFRELFVEKTQRLETLSDESGVYLRTQRSRATLQLDDTLDLGDIQ